MVYSSEYICICFTGLWSVFGQDIRPGGDGPCSKWEAACDRAMLLCKHSVGEREVEERRMHRMVAVKAVVPTKSTRTNRLMSKVARPKSVGCNPRTDLHFRLLCWMWRVSA